MLQIPPLFLIYIQVYLQLLEQNVKNTAITISRIKRNK